VRLAKLVATFIAYPNGPLPQAYTDWGSLKAACRFFSNRRVQARSLFDAHAASTMQRIEGHRVVVAAQDTTYITFTTHPRTSRLGPVGTGLGTAGRVPHNGQVLLPRCYSAVPY